MLLLVITCVVVIAALVVAHVRLRGRVEDLVTALGDSVEERDDVRASAESAATDAAEVADRLSEETAVGDALRSALASTSAELAEALGVDPGASFDVLWSLEARRSEQLWRMSIAVAADETSPLEGAEDLFRAMVEIEVAAAREESGADVEVEWKGLQTPASERALVALAFIRDVIASHGTSSATTTFVVDSADGRIDVVVESTDEDGTLRVIAIPGPLQVEPGRALIV